MLARIWEKEPFYTVGGNVNWSIYHGNQYGVSSKNLKIDVPYDAALPLLGIYLKMYKSI
jgi:hypothetical protein